MTLCAKNIRQLMFNAFPVQDLSLTKTALEMINDQRRI